PIAAGFLFSAPRFGHAAKTASQAARHDQSPGQQHRVESSSRSGRPTRSASSSLSSTKERVWNDFHTTLVWNSSRVGILFAGKRFRSTHTELRTIGKGFRNLDYLARDHESAFQVAGTSGFPIGVVVGRLGNAPLIVSAKGKLSIVKHSDVVGDYFGSIP